MKIELQQPEAEEKRLVARLNGGTLYLRGVISHGPDCRTVVLGSQFGKSTSVRTNGTRPIEDITGKKIYEGDTITITF